MIDTQAVKTSRAGVPERSYDGTKRLAGRKRHILADTNGLVLAVRVHGADLPDRDGAGGACWRRAWERSFLEWGWWEPTGLTRAVSASGPRRSWAGVCRCLTTATGNCGAKGSGGKAARLPDSAPAP